LPEVGWLSEKLILAEKMEIALEKEFAA